MIKEIERAIEDIMKIAKGFGLDYYPMRFEIVPADIMYTIGAYGMPTRFSHWTFGKSFYRMKLQYDLNLSRIYELVINNNPSYAFLLEGNKLVQNKMIIAHVLAHVDFFKNNVYFRQTNRQMVETMALAATRIRNYEIKYGKEKVEHFLDAVISIEEHIDPSIIKSQDTKKAKKSIEEEQEKRDKNKRKTVDKYTDLWEIGQTNLIKEEKLEKNHKFPLNKEKDILGFIEKHSKNLNDWQRDIITMLREEMYYFWPQIETKIMNEGWASFWHTRIMRELELNDEEIVDFAKLNAQVLQPSRYSLNPYYLGLKIFSDIEKKYGREKIFEARELDNDISFIRNYLTKELVEELDLYIYQKVGDDWIIVEKDWEVIRDQILNSRTNGGFPYIVIENADYLRNGELFLQHQYEGIELDVRYIEKTLPHIYTMWNKTVHIETIIEQKKVLFSYDGNKMNRKFI